MCRLPVMCAKNSEMIHITKRNELASRLNVAPVFVFADPVSCISVSKPPSLGVHGESKVDSTE